MRKIDLSSRIIRYASGKVILRALDFGGQRHVAAEQTELGEHVTLTVGEDEIPEWLLEPLAEVGSAA